MKRHVLTLLIVATSLSAMAQPQWKWAKRDTANYNVGPSYAKGALAVSANRSKVLWGVLQNKKITSGAALGDNAFHELDSSGNVMASTVFTGKFSLVQAQADTAGNWYVLAEFYDSISLGPSMTLTRNFSSNAANTVLFRLHAGTLAPDWLQLISNTSNIDVSCFAIANNKLFMPVDSLVATHLYQFDLGSGAATKLWTQTGRSSTGLIQVDSADNIYLIGSCVLNGPLSFNGTASTAPAGSKYPWYIARYRANGQHHWHHYMTDITCYDRSITLHGNNELYISGTLSDSTTLAGYQFMKPASFFNGDYIIARLDSNGALVWAQQRPITSITQGNVFFNSQFQSVVVDSSFYLFCESQGNCIWGSGGIATTSGTHHLATLVCYSTSTGNARWAKTIKGQYTAAQCIITDGVDLWAAGNGMDSNYLEFDTVSLASTLGVYLPYVAKMQVGTRKTSSPPPGTSVATQSNRPGVNVWPNPAADQITLEYLSGNELITLRDIAGRAVLQPEHGRGTMRINTAELARGVYFLELRDGQSMVVRRIVLE